MLYTKYYGCCRLFQTTIKSCKVPLPKSTDLNCIQVTTLTYCNIQVIQHHCAMLATATGNCAVTNATYNENQYCVVTWIVYREPSMYLRRRQRLRQIVVICHIACWFRSCAVLSLTSFTTQASSKPSLDLFPRKSDMRVPFMFVFHQSNCVSAIKRMLFYYRRSNSTTALCWLLPPVNRQSYMTQRPSLFTPISYYAIVFSFALIFANGWFIACDGFYGASAC